MLLANQFYFYRQNHTQLLMYSSFTHCLFILWYMITPHNNLYTIFCYTVPDFDVAYNPTHSYFIPWRASMHCTKLIYFSCRARYSILLYICYVLMWDRGTGVCSICSMSLCMYVCYNLFLFSLLMFWVMFRESHCVRQWVTKDDASIHYLWSCEGHCHCLGHDISCYTVPIF